MFLERHPVRPCSNAVGDTKRLGILLPSALSLSALVSWVQSWVQLEVLFQPKTGVKLRQINESVDGS